MAMTSLSIVLTVFVLQLHHVSPNTKPVPTWVRKLVIGVIARVIFMNSHLELYNKHLVERAERAKQKVNLSSMLSSAEAPGPPRYETSYHISDTPDSNNCNGRLGFNNRGTSNNGGHSSGSPATGGDRGFRQFTSGVSNVRSNRYQRYHPASSDTDSDNRNVGYDKVSSHLKVMVSQNEQEDEFQDIVHDWRLVAQIMDRFLFWLFLIGSTLSSLTILVFKPMEKPDIPT